jgi:signal transduction histidine kinase
MITRNAKRLLNLSSDILEVSRIESNTLQLSKEPIDLTQKIKVILDDMRSVIPAEKCVKLRFEPKSSKAVMIDVDRERIFQVISNLLSNAIKFTDEGEVVVELEEKDGQAIVHVRDSGHGIAPDIYPKLFTKFATKSDRGTGLGLYVAKNIAEAHGGSIWAVNNCDGKGATFTFKLPLSTFAVKDLENATKSEKG